VINKNGHENTGNELKTDYQSHACHAACIQTLSEE